jgi:hypothetical protein
MQRERKKHDEERRGTVAAVSPYSCEIHVSTFQDIENHNDKDPGNRCSARSESSSKCLKFTSFPPFMEEGIQLLEKENRQLLQEAGILQEDVITTIKRARELRGHSKALQTEVKLIAKKFEAAKKGLMAAVLLRQLNQLKAVNSYHARLLLLIMIVNIILKHQSFKNRNKC